MLSRRPSRKAPAYPPPKPAASSYIQQPRNSLTDDDITPKANAHLRPTSPTTTATSSAPSMASRCSWRRSTDSSATDFDDLYDLSDDDSAFVPIKISNSVKDVMSRANIRRDTLPSLIIPSPSAWPTIQKLKKSGASPVASLFTPVRPPLSPAAINRLNNVNLRVPTAHSTPSLDEAGFTSDEPFSASPCPSTPDLRCRNDQLPNEWDMPAQLPQQAMETLQQLAAFEFGIAELGPIIEISEAKSGEMQDRGLRIEAVATPKPVDAVASEPCSGISIPSPGGFFASLRASAKDVWGMDFQAETPDSAAAESFYHVPSSHGPSSDMINQTPSYAHQRSASGQDSVARQKLGRTPSINENQETFLRRENREYEYDETYETKLHETATSNMSRTSMWLSAQELYLSGLNEGNPINDVQPKTTPPMQTSTTPKSSSELTRSTFTSPSKKSVRFAEPQKTPPITAIRIESEKSDPLFYHAFQHQWDKSRRTDAFALRRLRADAIQAQRLYLPERHRAQLLGHFRLATPQCPAKEFAHLPAAPTDAELQKYRDAIAKADRERQAIQQITLSSWTVEAQRYLAGGHLLPKPAREVLHRTTRRGRIPRVLDFGGQPTADWGWAVAMEHRNAKVYTAVPSSPTRCAFALPKDWAHHRGPSNHRTLTIPNPWTLPFPSNSIDVISARTLPSLLRTSRATAQTQPPQGLSASHFKPPRTSSMSPVAHQYQAFASDFSMKAMPPLPPQAPETSPSGPTPPVESGSPIDEYAATLSELHRVLAPGGVLSFSLLDAELAASPTKTSFFSPATPTDDGVENQINGTVFNFPAAPSSNRSVSNPIHQTSLTTPGQTNRSVSAPHHFPTASSTSTSTTSPPAPAPASAAPALGPNAQALLSRSTSFAITLRNLGYDPCSGSRIGSRLTEAGFNFSRIRKNWVELPLGERQHPANSSITPCTTSSTSSSSQTKLVKSETDTGAITSLHGSVLWERWIMKCQLEQHGGIETTRALESVGRAIESARAEGGVGWRCCVGWARK
ncbi:MAG: hypothetical protein M1828_006354 [Chrysothrix sp. TS-e1954]|nr:MAG: hypothetical protein M1828_006354 [Chrysothrix sp. TS-e1954]